MDGTAVATARPILRSIHLSLEKGIAPCSGLLDLSAELKENPLSLTSGVEQAGVQEPRIKAEGVQTDLDRLLSGLLNKVNEFWSPSLDFLGHVKRNLNHDRNVANPFGSGKHSQRRAALLAFD